jgi:hypothetical protein
VVEVAVDVRVMVASGGVAKEEAVAAMVLVVRWCWRCWPFPTRVVLAPLTVLEVLAVRWCLCCPPHDPHLGSTYHTPQSPHPTACPRPQSQHRKHTHGPGSFYLQTPNSSEDSEETKFIILSSLCFCHHLLFRPKIL